LKGVFFTDRDLGTRFPDILRSAGLSVERHRDHFPPDARDEDWLAAVGARGWVALTHDRRIRYKPNELGAVVRHGVALLVIVGRAPYPELATAFVATLPRIETFLAGHEPPFVGKVFRPSPAEVKQNPAAAGRVELWYPR
jgi:predicted nuclease of predicted toxin-antitoxin system